MPALVLPGMCGKGKDSVPGIEVIVPIHWAVVLTDAATRLGAVRVSGEEMDDLRTAIGGQLHPCDDIGSPAGVAWMVG